MMIDVTVNDEGTVMLFTPQTEAAHEWVDEHVELDGAQFLGGAFAVDWRMAEPIIDGMLAVGLAVELN